MAVRKIRKPCPHCGGTEFVRGVMNNLMLQHPKHPLGARYIVQCQICKKCGTIVRRFISHPDELPDF